MKYLVSLPISGVVSLEVEADTKESAIDVALKSELTLDNIDEWEAHRYLVRGNVCYASLTEATVEEA